MSKTSASIPCSISSVGRRSSPYTLSIGKPVVASLLEDTFSSATPIRPCSGLKSATNCTPGACLSSSMFVRPCASSPVWFVISPTRFPRSGANFSASSTSRPVCTRPARPRCPATRFCLAVRSCPATILGAQIAAAHPRTNTVRAQTLLALQTFPDRFIRSPVNCHGILARFAPAFVVSAKCVWYIYTRSSGAPFGRLHTNARVPRPVSAADSLLDHHRSYGPQSAKPKPPVCRERIRHTCRFRRNRPQKEREPEEPAARRQGLGREDHPPDEHGRENRPTALYHLSRQLHRHRFARVQKHDARRGRLARRRLHPRHPKFTAWGGQKPGLSHRRAGKSTAIQIKTPAAHRRRF